MKNLILALFLLMGTFAIAQNNTVTVEIPVRGNCEMCKKRIENAADIKGVKLAEWSNKDQSLKVIYNPKKTNEETIIAALTAVGHEAKGQKPTKEKYESLPGCCQYETNKCDMK